ncbi:MobC family plasmid mobilization relaxosome protein [Ruminococcus sp.]|nr:MobC family plasmid mobilization relaxosome protein [Ruminococcus sp.]MEE3492632.1 MobC family plasmid mobilization relaxosome protein [Ruminococcus sp.]
MPQVCGKASLFGRRLLSPPRRGVLGARMVARTRSPGGSPDPLHTYILEVIIIVNRKRNQTISIRLTAAEKKEIATKAKQAQMSLTDYLIACSRQTEIKVTDLSGILIELKRIGNNINQLARKANSRRIFYPKFDSVAAELRTIYDAILSLKDGD